MHAGCLRRKRIGHLAARAAARMAVQSRLANFLVLVDLFLVIFVAPPTPWWARGQSAERRRVAITACSRTDGSGRCHAPHAAIAHAVCARPGGLTPLALAVVMLLIWLFTVRWCWRAHLLMCPLGKGDSEPPEILAEGSSAPLTAS